ncbi:MAG TPA: hypothetical protein VFQ44_01370 [Streptosporangiaceae bacterium]|nr:hypothetical protein [Streptosporangiaceae bacterium]
MLIDGGGSTGGLFLEPVPVPPGDPGALSKAAGIYNAAQGEIERQQARLTGLAGQAGGGVWTGTGAANYVTATHELAAVYGLTGDSLAKGATALRVFSADLTNAKRLAHEANAAVATSNAAARAYLAAQNEAGKAQANADDAATTSTNAQNTANANPHSVSARHAADTARTTADDAQNAADAAASRASTLLSHYEADYSRAVTLCSQAQERARQAYSRAGTALNAAGTALMGKQVKPVRGGAHPESGGSAWTAVIDDLADGNDKAGWGLNAWGAFGAVVLTKTGVVYLESQADLGKAVGTYDEAIDAVMSKQGFFKSGFYDAQDAFNAAKDANVKAITEFQDAIRPAAGDNSVMALLGKAGLGLGMASDVITFTAPTKSFGPDGLLGGNTDRAMAAANFAASGLALGGSMDIGLATTALAIPGVDVIAGGVLVGTAAYFAGEYVYQHWGTISHAVTSSIHEAGNWAGHELDNLGHALTHPFGL